MISQFKSGLTFISAVALGGMMLVAAPAQAQEGEQLYLSDTGVCGDGYSTLYQVYLNPGTGNAELTPLPNGVIPMDQVDAMACTPDGSRLYMLDTSSASCTTATFNIGYYEFATASFHVAAELQQPTDGVEFRFTAQAAFSPEGLLYAVHNPTDTLYQIDVETGVMNRVGQIVNVDTDGVADVAGGDIAFSFDGSLLWVNKRRDDTPRGMYSLELPASGEGEVLGTHQGTFGTDLGHPAAVTGMAYRANGIGDIAICDTNRDKIFVSDLDTGITVEQYNLTLNGEPFDHITGDMAGPLGLTPRTIGYWKNHYWGGQIMTICGVEVDEALGWRILEKARGNTFAMLVAQLIAAKINVSNATGVDAIEQAEAWLCDQGIVRDGVIYFDTRFASKDQKRAAVPLKEALDDFNDSYQVD